MSTITLPLPDLPASTPKPRGASAKPRRVHKAHMVRPDGSISPLCARHPRAIDMHRSTWTLDDEAVTCPKCIACLLEDM